MAASLNDVSHAEPSSDFPTDEDVNPCARITRTTSVAVAIGAVAVVVFLVGRALARRRDER